MLLPPVSRPREQLNSGRQLSPPASGPVPDQARAIPASHPPRSPHRAPPRAPALNSSGAFVRQRAGGWRPGRPGRSGVGPPARGLCGAFLNCRPRGFPTLRGAALGWGDRRPLRRLGGAGPQYRPAATAAASAAHSSRDRSASLPFRGRCRSGLERSRTSAKSPACRRGLAATPQRRPRQPPPVAGQLSRLAGPHYQGTNEAQQ